MNENDSSDKAFDHEHYFARLLEICNTFSVQGSFSFVGKNILQSFSFVRVRRRPTMVSSLMAEVSERVKGDMACRVVIGAVSCGSMTSVIIEVTWYLIDCVHYAVASSFNVNKWKIWNPSKLPRTLPCE